MAGYKPGSWGIKSDRPTHRSVPMGTLVHDGTKFNLIKHFANELHTLCALQISPLPSTYF